MPPGEFWLYFEAKMPELFRESEKERLLRLLKEGFGGGG
jgi:hypothetical protein